MKNLFKSTYKIVSLENILKETKDGNKNYYVLKLYIDFSDVIITSFVSKEVYDKIKENKINDTNIIEHLYFKIDKDMKCHIFIK